MISPFHVARLPAIDFAAGSAGRLPELAASFGRRLLLVTGEASFLRSRHWPSLREGLERHGVSWERLAVAGEPSPETIDDAVARWRGASIDCVAGVGGGSVLDAGKAVAGLLPSGSSVMEHLEGVGRGKPYRGPALPFLAVPTTAGTGSEATKNAVLSRRGPQGFKKSFRDEALVARHALVDPGLLEGCPPGLIAADGMDALTQLVESYVSPRSNPFTDALAESGLAAVRDGLLPWYEGTADVDAARERMAWAALVSGITLAQAGLGAVHGLASPLGAFHPMPHGLACGTLLAAATAVNVAALRERDPRSPALARYGRIATILEPVPSTGSGVRWQESRAEDLLDLLERWTLRLGLPGLASYGVREADLGRIVADSRGSSMKTNPVVLSDSEIERILRTRL